MEVSQVSVVGAVALPSAVAAAVALLLLVPWVYEMVENESNADGAQNNAEKAESDVGDKDERSDLLHKDLNSAASPTSAPEESPIVLEVFAEIQAAATEKSSNVSLLRLEDEEEEEEKQVDDNENEEVGEEGSDGGEKAALPPSMVESSKPLANMQGFEKPPEHDTPQMPHSDQPKKAIESQKVPEQGGEKQTKEIKEPPKSAPVPGSSSTSKKEKEEAPSSGN